MQRPIRLDQFQCQGRQVRIYLTVPELTADLWDRRCGKLLGVTIFPPAHRKRAPVVIYLNAHQSIRSLRITYLHELSHVVLEPLGLRADREEKIVLQLEGLYPILKRYALRLPCMETLHAYTRGFRSVRYRGDRASCIVHSSSSDAGCGGRLSGSLRTAA